MDECSEECAGVAARCHKDSNAWKTMLMIERRDSIRALEGGPVVVKELYMGGSITDIGVQKGILRVSGSGWGQNIMIPSQHRIKVDEFVCSFIKNRKRERDEMKRGLSNGTTLFYTEEVFGRRNKTCIMVGGRDTTTTIQLRLVTCGQTEELGVSTQTGWTPNLDCDSLEIKNNIELDCEYARCSYHYSTTANLVDGEIVLSAEAQQCVQLRRFDPKHVQRVVTFKGVTASHMDLHSMFCSMAVDFFRCHTRQECIKCFLELVSNQAGEGGRILAIHPFVNNQDVHDLVADEQSSCVVDLAPLTPVDMNRERLVRWKSGHVEETLDPVLLRGSTEGGGLHIVLVGGELWGFVDTVRIWEHLERCHHMYDEDKPKIKWTVVVFPGGAYGCGQIGKPHEQMLDFVSGTETRLKTHYKKTDKDPLASIASLAYKEPYLQHTQIPHLCKQGAIVYMDFRDDATKLHILEVIMANKASLINRTSEQGERCGVLFADDDNIRYDRKTITCGQKERVYRASSASFFVPTETSKVLFVLKKRWDNIDKDRDYARRVVLPVLSTIMNIGTEMPLYVVYRDI